MVSDEGAAAATAALDDALIEPTVAVTAGSATGSALEAIRWEGRTIAVPPLELQRAVSERRGLVDRIRLIDAFGG